MYISHKASDPCLKARGFFIATAALCTLATSNTGAATSPGLAASAANAATPPTQVVYRFDDHRYLELTGFGCEGALWYTDTKLGIHTEVMDRFYRVFTKEYIHPSERYISITGYGFRGFLISKDYGRTWEGASFSPGGGADLYGERIPARKSKQGFEVPEGEFTSPWYEDVVSFTVVNDQGFMLTKWGDLYISSKPFDDPRLQPGGTGIDYVFNGVKHHLGVQDNGTGNNSYWGKNYTSWASIQGDRPWKTFAYQSNFQGIPNQIPEVKNYTGWDKMRCDPDLGLPVTEQGK